MIGFPFPVVLFERRRNVGALQSQQSDRRIAAELEWKKFQEIVCSSLTIRCRFLPA
jgi:hypothetical protein